jgi:hypothetical protein
MLQQISPKTGMQHSIFLGTLLIVFFFGELSPALADASGTWSLKLNCSYWAGWTTTNLTIRPAGGGGIEGSYTQGGDIKGQISGNRISFTDGRFRAEATFGGSTMSGTWHPGGFTNDKCTFVGNRTGGAVARQTAAATPKQPSGQNSGAAVRADKLMESGRRIEAAAKATTVPGSGLGKQDCEQLLSRAEDTYAEATSLYRKSQNLTGERRASTSLARAKASYVMCRDSKKRVATIPQAKGKLTPQQCKKVLRAVIRLSLEEADTALIRKKAKAAGCPL